MFFAWDFSTEKPIKYRHTENLERREGAWSGWANDRNDAYTAGCEQRSESKPWRRRPASIGFVRELVPSHRRRRQVVHPRPIWVSRRCHGVLQSLPFSFKVILPHSHLYLVKSPIFTLNVLKSLYRGIDFAVANNEVPAKANDLPVLLRQVCCSS